MFGMALVFDRRFSGRKENLAQLHRLGSRGGGGVGQSSWWILCLYIFASLLCCNHIFSFSCRLGMEGERSEY